MEPTVLSHIDTAWYRAHREQNQMVIRGMFWLEGRVDMELLAKTIDERLLPFHRFHRRIEERWRGRPQWVDVESFDVFDHLTHLRADRPDLEKLLGELAVLPLDMTKPPWHAHVIELDDGSTVLFFRIHHAVGDGQALVHVLLSLSDPVEVDGEVDPERRRDRHWKTSAQPEPPDPGLSGIVRSALSVVAKPANWVRQAFINIAKVLVLLRITLIPPDSATVLRGRLGTAKAVAWTDALSVERVRAVAETLDATINDVLLSTVAGALRRYVDARGTPIDSAELRAMVPVDVRPKDVVPDMGNRFGLVVFTMPAAMTDPVERVRETSRRMDKIKRRPEAGVGYGLIRLLGLIPGAVEKLLIRFFASKASLVITNVIGPRHQMMIADAHIRDLLVFVPQSGNIGVGVAIFSYNGRVRVSVMSDRLRLPDPQRVAELFADEFAALEANL